MTNTVDQHNQPEAKKHREEMSRMNKVTMQNKPQLSAEMEKRFDEQFSVFDGSQKIIKHVTYSKWIKHFLATALEEQRQKVLSEVEGWLVDVKEPKSGISDYVDDFARHSVNEYCAELRTKLNQLKGSDE